MSDLSPIQLTPRLHFDKADDAVVLLRAYFAGAYGRGGWRFEGGWWDDFDPSGSREVSSDVFTADDLLSATLLSAPIHATAALMMLGEKADVLARGLRGLGPDRDLAALSDEEVRRLESVNELWRLLRSLPHLGRTRTSKLMARKRPRLVPIYDQVVGEVVFGGTSKAQWSRLHTALAADSGALNEHLLRLRRDAGLLDVVSPLRVFDVIAWLDASKKAEVILAS